MLDIITGFVTKAVSSEVGVSWIIFLVILFLIIIFSIRHLLDIAVDLWRIPLAVIIDAVDILAYNNEWKNMPWRKIISNKYKENFGFIKEVLPYDESKGEFVFFGMDWCEPCKKVAKILIDNKIKFREEESDTGAVPRIYYQNKVIDKADGIIDKIREMYGLSKSELIKIFRNY